MSETHPAALQHQFEDLGQQYQASNLGMWVFIVQEILFFGGLFTGYTVYRNMYLPAFVEGSHHLSLPLGAFNTVILIASSLTMALAVRAAQQGRRNGILGWLIATMVQGTAFLVVKYFEYADK